MERKLFIYLSFFLTFFLLLRASLEVSQTRKKLFSVQSPLMYFLFTVSIITLTPKTYLLILNWLPLTPLERPRLPH